MANHFKLVYTATGEEVASPMGGYHYSENREEAEKMALEFSLSAHESQPDHVDEEGKVFIMDWLGYNKPYYGNESKFVQYITVEEVKEEEDIEEED